MSTVTVSPKYQIVIPRDARNLLHIKSGQKLSVIVSKDMMYVLPEKTLDELEGFAEGIDTSGIRDEEDRY